METCSSECSLLRNLFVDSPRSWSRDWPVQKGVDGFRDDVGDKVHRLHMWGFRSEQN
jgi:hypothetical protein